MFVTHVGCQLYAVHYGRDLNEARPGWDVEANCLEEIVSTVRSEIVSDTMATTTTTTQQATGVTEEQRDAVIKYQRLREEVDELYSKLSQIESDRSEHE